MSRIAVVGATGAVGTEAVTLLERSGARFSDISFFASSGSAKRKTKIQFRGYPIPVEDIETADFSQFAAAIFSIGSTASKKYIPRARDAGCTVIDNSSAYRMDPDVPLVVPEINAKAIEGHRGIIANPNCTTAITMMALCPLHRLFGATSISVTSYQAASGAGDSGRRELFAELVAHHGETRTGVWKQRRQDEPDPVFPHPIALNVFPEIGTFLENGYTDEEMKLLKEGGKILDHPNLKVSTTCVRVPVERVHSMDVLAQFERTIDIPAAYEALRRMPGLFTHEGNGYGTPLMYSGKYDCAVGRLRKDIAFDNALRFWVVGDQLLKGAALNAVQILERLL